MRERDGESSKLTNDLTRQVTSKRLRCGRHSESRLAIKGVDLTGLLGGHKKRLGVCGMEVPQRGPGAEPL